MGASNILYKTTKSVTKYLNTEFNVKKQHIYLT